MRTRSTGRETARNTDRTFRYGPYGENTTSEGTQTIPYPFGYKSGYRMPGGNKGEGNVTNGLYHYGQRYYDPTTGRWTQQDPEDRFGSTTQGDRFLFAGGDPIDQSDPTGTISEAEAINLGLTGLGCTNPESVAGLYTCAAGIGGYETEDKPLGVVEEFYKGISEAANLGSDID